MALQFESLLNAGINAHQANAIMDEFHDPLVLNLDVEGSGINLPSGGNVIVKGVALSLNGSWADVRITLPAYDGMMPGTKVRIANFTGDNTNGPSDIGIHSASDSQDINGELGDDGGGDSTTVTLPYGRIGTFTFEGEVYSSFRQGKRSIWTYSLSDTYEAPPPTPAYVNHMTTLVGNTFNNVTVIPTPTRNDHYYVLHYGTVSGHRNFQLPPKTELSKIEPGSRMHFLAATNYVTGTWAPNPFRIFLPTVVAADVAHIFFPTDASNVTQKSLEAGHMATITYWGQHRVHNAVGLTANDERHIWYWQETTNVDQT